MDILWGLLTFPYAPVRGLTSVLKVIAREAEAKQHDPANVRRELEELDRAAAAGDITTAERDAGQQQVLDRLTGTAGSSGAPAGGRATGPATGSGRSAGAGGARPGGPAARAGGAGARRAATGERRRARGGPPRRRAGEGGGRGVGRTDPR
ncbi:gas vesicle protein GvpG [Micromonospora siamensis]|uniref:Gas vesicle protein G n=1 Tax=Micromonospora siamensis TaxID=299152 RepID=A0A1C5GM34_9ACTN|nr:gas vesicle protein GvpG [Micromonospora siamensis]SCG34839.1 Gas vesicle protein G [Micromonospora siamensis]